MGKERSGERDIGGERGGRERSEQGKADIEVNTDTRKNR